MTRKINHANVAKTARRDSRRYARENEHFGTDAEMRAVIARDVKALNAVADLIESGDLRAAYRRWSRLDTIVREAISRSVWLALTGGLAYDHTRHDR